MKRLLFACMALLCAMVSHAQISPVSNFGSDPGNLNMYTYIPSGIPSNAPLVLVLHGCTQDAVSYANESDWNSLADEYKFYVIYAEQPAANNFSRCFNWFQSGDANRGAGEAASLKSMVDYMKSNYSVNNNGVYVTGFSAGGAMTTVMLAAYPDVFTGGAVMSGLPYDVANGTSQAFQAMQGNVNLSPAQLGNKVRNASSHTGPWPTVSIFHGTSDYTVNYVNENEVMEQWTNVHGVDQSPDVNTPSYLGNSTVTKKAYENGAGDPVVVTYSFNAMGHAIAIDPGTGPSQGGNSGTYTRDINFWSSFYAAEFFGLMGPTLSKPTNVTASASAFDQVDLTWTNNEPTATAISIERSLNANGPFSSIATLPASSTSYTDAGLTQLTTYHYRISVTDGSSTVAGDIVSATTPSDGSPAPPAAPSNLAATSTGQTSISLSWSDNSNNEAEFVLERSTGNASNYSVIANLPANTTSYSDGGLTSNTAYFYRLKAQNSVGASSSLTANATTDGQATVVTIEQPTGTGILSYFNFNDMGQSFTSIADGELISVEVNLVLPISGSTLKIFAGNTVSGAAIYEVSGISAGSGWQTITLPNPVSVINGQQYTFQLTDASIKYTYSNAYSGGNFWYNSISYSVFDAAFKVSINTTSSAQKNFEEVAEPGPVFHVFPNPSQGRIRVELDAAFAGGVIEVLSLDGRMLKTLAVEGHREDIDLRELGAGFYLLKVTHAGQQRVVRLVVQ